MLWEDIHHLSQIMELFSPKFSGAGKKVLWWKKEKKKLILGVFVIVVVLIFVCFFMFCQHVEY